MLKMKNSDTQNNLPMFLSILSDEFVMKGVKS